MPANITPVDTFTTVITVPIDGDAANGTEVALTTQPLANRSENNNSRLNKIPQVGTVTDFLVPLIGFGVEVVGAWTYTPSSSTMITDGLATGGLITFDVTPYLPEPGATLDSVVLYVDGGSGRGGLPAVLPQLLVNRYSKADFSETAISSLTDTSGSLGAYEQTHTISITSIGHTILADNNYLFTVTAESGANSSADQFGINAMELGWTYP